jgi:hypothetical protein
MSLTLQVKHCQVLSRSVLDKMEDLIEGLQNMLQMVDGVACSDTSTASRVVQRTRSKSRRRRARDLEKVSGVAVDNQDVSVCDQKDFEDLGERYVDAFSQF